MGMTAFELFGILKLDKKEFESGLNDAKKDAESFGKSVDNAANKSSGFGSKIGTVAGAAAKGFGIVAKAGAVAVGAATTAAGAFAKSSIEAATSYESAFTGVRKTVDFAGQTAEEAEASYKQLSDWIMEASTKMASSKEDIAATMEIAGQLGVKGVEGLEEFTKTMIMLGDTTNLNAEEAAGALARFGNIAGVDATDMSKLGSVIVDLGNNFATTESDIVNMATRLASSATVAGLSATDIMALSTAMSSVGIQAEAGGTAMAQTIAKMESAVANGAEDMTKSWEDLAASSWEDLSGLESFARVSGMSAQEFSDAWKGEPIQAITAFINGLHDLDEADESVILTLEELGLKGIRQSNMLQSLALASDMMGNAIDTANTAFEENVALQNEAATRYGTTESAAMQAAEAFSNLKVKIGEELQPTYQEFLSFSSTAMQAMSEGFDEGGINGLMAAMGTALSEGLSKIGEILPDAVKAGEELLGALVQGIIENLPSIATAGVDILTELITSFVDALPDIGSGISAFFEALGQAFADNSEALLGAGQTLLETLINGIVENLPSMIEGLSELVVGLAEWLTNPDTLTPLIEGAVNIIMALADGLIQALPKFIEAAPVIIQNLVTAIVDNLPMLVTAAIQLVGAVAQYIIENLPLVIAAAIQIVFSLVSGIIEALPSLVTAIMELMSEIVRVVIDSLPKLIENGVKIVGALVEGIVKTIGSIIKAAISVVDEFIKGLKNGWAKIIQAGVNVIVKVREGIKQKLNEAKQWGSDLIKNFIDGIKAKFEALKNTVKSVGKMIKSLLGFSEPEEGPLSNFHTYAPDMMKLFAKGITDNKNLIMDAVDDTFDLKDAIAVSPIGSVSDNNVSAGSVLRSMQNESAGNKNLTVILELDKTQFARAVYQLNNAETQRVGLKLAGGLA